MGFNFNWNKNRHLEKNHSYLVTHSHILKAAIIYCLIFKVKYKKHITNIFSHIFTLNIYFRIYFIVLKKMSILEINSSFRSFDNLLENVNFESLRPYLYLNIYNILYFYFLSNFTQLYTVVFHGSISSIIQYIVSGIIYSLWPFI